MSVRQIDSWGAANTIYFYAVFCAICILFAFFLPETKGVALEDMDKIFGSRKNVVVRDDYKQEEN